MDYTQHIPDPTIYIDEDGKDVTKFIKEGKTKVYNTYNEAYSKGKSYVYEVLMIKTLAGQKITSHFGYAVPN